MKKIKRRVAKKEAPGYPQRDEISMGRRSFLTLIGAGSLALMSACGGSEVLGGVARLPEYDIRLPLQGKRHAYLTDRSELNYVISIHYRNDSLRSYVTSNEKSILNAMDRVAASYSYYQMANKNNHSEVAAKMYAKFVELYKKAKNNNNPDIETFKVEITGLVEGSEKMGGAAPPPKP